MKMKVLKRNQLIILITSLMLITAGYLNFTANSNREDGTAVETVAELGDAILVNNTVEDEDGRSVVEDSEDNTQSEEGNAVHTHARRRTSRAKHPEEINIL